MVWVLSLQGILLRAAEVYHPDISHGSSSRGWDLYRQQWPERRCPVQPTRWVCSGAYGRGGGSLCWCVGEVTGGTCLPASRISCATWRAMSMSPARSKPAPVSLTLRAE